MAGDDLEADRTRIVDQIRRATAEGGTSDIAFAPSGCGHRISIGPDGVFVITPCSRSEVNEVQARKVIAALTGWLGVQVAPRGEAMRKLHYEVRQPTLEELDASAVRAKVDMDAWREQGEYDLASVCEKAMNRFLEAKTERLAVDAE